MSELPVCEPCSLPLYPGRRNAQIAGQLAHSGAYVSSYHCPAGGGAHYRIRTRAEIAARRRAEGEDVTEADIPPASLSREALRLAELGPAQYDNCPKCRAQWGQPHTERCRRRVPGYDDHDLPNGLVRPLAAYVLAVFPLDVVRRSTIRSLLPLGQTMPDNSRASVSRADRTGRGGATFNPTSRMFAEVLHQWGIKGWISTAGERTDPNPAAPGSLVVIHAGHRPKLRRIADTRLDTRTGERLLAGLRQAIVALIGSMPEVAAVREQEQRERELTALRRLMQQAPGQGPHQGRGHVRLPNVARNI